MLAIVLISYSISIRMATHRARCIWCICDVITRRPCQCQLNIVFYSPNNYGNAVTGKVYSGALKILKSSKNYTIIKGFCGGIIVWYETS